MDVQVHRDKGMDMLLSNNLMRTAISICLGDGFT
jgi:hypothetical protein